MREGAEQYGLSKSDYRVDARRELDKHTFVIDVRPTNAPRPNCPKCKDPMQKHSTKQHQLYHGSFDNKRCIINLTRQRWQCAKCKTTHLQRSPLIWPHNKHLSTNAAIRIAELLQTGVNAAIIAAEIGASKNSIQAVRRTLLASIEAAPLPRHLCIDEMVPTRNLYAKASKRMPDLVTCIYDGENSTLKDMIAGRSAPAIRAWAAQYSTGERMRVKVITCDMCWPFIRAMEEAFPGVPICVDKYHVVKRFKDAVIAERNRCFPPNEARTKGLALGSIRTLTKRESKAISESEQAKIWHVLTLPEAENLRFAYLSLQAFYDWSDTRFVSPEKRAQAYRRLIKEMRQGNTAEMNAMANTLEEFSPYILNAWTLNKTNCNAESVNSRIRKVIRDRRGFYSFEHLRAACLISLGTPHKHMSSVKLYQDEKRC